MGEKEEKDQEDRGCRGGLHFLLSTWVNKRGVTHSKLEASVELRELAVEATGKMKNRATGGRVKRGR